MLDESLLTCLTDDGKLFAIVRSDQRLQCFETGTGSAHGDLIRLPAEHIPACIATRCRLLAIGMTSGSVVICDLSKGAVIHQANAHGDRVHALCFNSDATRLYICSNDGRCSEWELTADQFQQRRQFRPSKRSIVKSIAISSDDTLLACGSSTIRLIDTSSLKSVAKLRGHAGEIAMMRFNAGCDVLYSIAHGDRTINTFRFKEAKSAKETVDASGCFTLTDQPRTLTIGKTAIGCVLQSGNVAIFNTDHVMKKSKQKSWTDFIMLNCAGSAMDVQFVAPDTVLISGGNIAQPVFKSSSIDQSRDLSPFEVKSDAERIQRKRGTTEAPVEVVSATVKKSRSDQVATPVTAAETLPLPLDDGEGVVTSDSMITLLLQGLKSNDNQKLSLVLDQTRDSFISATLSRLPPAMIPSLVSVLVKRIRTSTKPKHLANTMNWFAYLLRRHTAYLLGNEAVADQLAEAKSLLENRLKSASSLMALSGRLSILRCQLQNNQMAHEKASQPILFVHDVINEQ